MDEKRDIRMTREQATIVMGVLDLMGIGGDVISDDDLLEYDEDGDAFEPDPDHRVWLVEIPPQGGIYKYVTSFPDQFACLVDDLPVPS